MLIGSYGSPDDHSRYAVAPRSAFDRMNAFFNEHKIRPVIDKVHPFEKAREAYEHLAKGVFGKVVTKIA
ncbi:hypothetical protein D3C80_1187230 [compost metagenome]